MLTKGLVMVCHRKEIRISHYSVTFPITRRSCISIFSEMILPNGCVCVLFNLDSYNVMVCNEESRSVVFIA